MEEEIKKKNEKVETYEIGNKKYTVISLCIEDNFNIDKIYDVLCKIAINKLSQGNMCEIKNKN